MGVVVCVVGLVWVSVLVTQAAPTFAAQASSVGVVDKLFIVACVATPRNHAWPVEILDRDAHVRAHHGVQVTVLFQHPLLRVLACIHKEES